MPAPIVLDAEADGILLLTLAFMEAATEFNSGAKYGVGLPPGFKSRPAH